MRKIYFPLIFMLWNAVSTHAQDFSNVEPIIDANLSNYNNNVLVWVKQNHETLYKLKKGTFDTTSQQLIASCTKWISGAVMLALEDKGYISLDDSIGKFLPLFTTYGKGSPSIRQCLSHTSGFPGYSAQDYEGDNTLTLSEAVDSIATHVPFLYNPGEGFYYGSVSMHICGRIAEVVTGKSWTSVFNEHIGAPCQMPNTYYFPIFNPLIAGGGYSTPEDYMNFLEMILDRGKFNGTTVLSENAIREMYRDQTDSAFILYSPVPNNPFNLTDTLRYGIGDWQDVPGEQISSPGLFGSYPWVDTCRKLTGIIFTFTTLDSVFVSNILTIDEFRTQLPNCLDTQTISSVEEALFDPGRSFRISPNPVTDQLSVHFTDGIPAEVPDIRIYDLVGNLVKKESLGSIRNSNLNWLTLHVSELENGIYLVVFGEQFLKFTKQ